VKDGRRGKGRTCGQGGVVHGGEAGGSCPGSRGEQELYPACRFFYRRQVPIGAPVPNSWWRLYLLVVKVTRVRECNEAKE